MLTLENELFETAVKHEQTIINRLNLDLFDTEFWKIHKIIKFTIINILSYLCLTLYK